MYSVMNFAVGSLVIVTILLGWIIYAIFKRIHCANVDTPTDKLEESLRVPSTNKMTTQSSNATKSVGNRIKMLVIGPTRSGRRTRPPPYLKDYYCT